MKQFQATVVQKDTIAPAWWEMVISGPDLVNAPAPGQFFLTRCGDRFSPYLRRPIFPRIVDDNQLSILLRPDPDPGFAWLSARQVGDGLDLIGPLGTGFELPARAGNLLLVGDSQQITPLLGQLERAIEAGHAVTLALESIRAATIYPVSALPPIVELQAATLDGSLGHHGPVLDLMPGLLPWADMVCAVGSPKLYRALRVYAAETRLKLPAGYLYGLIADGLGVCGVGACFSCTVTTTRGLKLACLDGPVFDLADLDDLDVGGGL
jgi:dihydroorotate dehydrogenase electron transfer subunit